MAANVLHWPDRHNRRMTSRREFLKSAAALGVAGLAGVPASNSLAQPIASSGSDVSDREYWVATLEKIARPVLENLSQRQLKKNMPVEADHPAGRAPYTHLEACGRLTAGIAPWLVAPGLNGTEAQLQKEFAGLARLSLDAATDPQSPDFMSFCHGAQPIVDTAFLAQGILRAPSVLWQPLEPRVQRQVIAALKSSRAIPTPTKNNWTMFAATIEAALQTLGETPIQERYEDCVQLMLGWYKGDGAYGDGEFFHWDYYNSFVIHPMLLDTLAVLKQSNSQYEAIYKTELTRARRYAEIEERLIAPDGTFPSLGRSTTYRFGAFHALAQIALKQELSKHLKPAQVRCAMTAVIRKMIEAPGTFDENGWLQIGFCGHQPSLAEGYISTGSLYLCSTALLPLGLPPSDEFWSGPVTPWTSQQLWSGQSLPPDHAINDIQ
jgi:hypothetical protein